KSLKDEMERPDLMNLTDSEANAIIDRHLLAEQKRLDLKRNLIMQLKTAITPRKILLLHAAERDFNRELLQKANGYRRD
nr:hypothetical protein [Bacteroidota bacterium]